MKRLWILGLLSSVAAFAAAACGGDASLSPASLPPSSPTPEIEISPTATQQPAVVPRYEWEVSVIDDNGAKPSVAVDADGIPHIAFMLEAMPGFVKHAVLNSNQWTTSTVSTGYVYGPLDIQVDQVGVPHIVWHNHDEENEAYAVLNGTTWIVRDVDHPGHDGWDNSLAIDATGQVHTASIDPSQFGSRSGIEYATFDGQSWIIEEVGSGPIPYEFGTDIALDAEDQPHLVWFDEDNGDLKYAKKSDESWDITTVDSEGDVGRFPSLVLDSQGNPSVSYYERQGASKGYIKFASWDGTVWNTQRIDELHNVSLGFFAARRNNSLVLGTDGNPIVVYSDLQVIKVAWWDGSKWNLETVLNADGLPFGQQVSIAIDAAGILHLTFANVERQGSPGVKGSILYARGVPSSG